MQANNSKRRFSRSGCPSIHFLFRRDLAEYCGPNGLNRMAGGDMFCRSTGHNYAQDFHCAAPGHRRPEWDIC